jgi:Protein of unknown function (DUF3800)
MRKKPIISVERPYDAFEHVWRGLFWRPDTLVTAISAYFDDSGKKETEVLLVGGYVAPVAQWERFCDHWRLLLAKKHLDEFKRSKFLRFPKPAGLRILQDFAQIIEDFTVQAFACAVWMEDWKAANRKFQMTRFHMYPYAICARTCVKMVRDWCRGTGRKTSEAEYFFDEGSEHADEFGKLLKFDRNPEVKAIIPIPGKSHKIRPLQAADFFAWETRNQVLIDPQPEPWKASLALRTLLRLPNRANVGEYRLSDLENMCIAAEIPLREG